MTKPAFTKGPWHIDGEGGIRAGQRLVARYPNHPENRVNWDNDAHLIAAAPDYDAAARAYVLWVETFKDELPESVRLGMEAGFGGLLRAALAKAEGRS